MHHKAGIGVGFVAIKSGKPRLWMGLPENRDEILLPRHGISENIEIAISLYRIQKTGKIENLAIGKVEV